MALINTLQAAGAIQNAYSMTHQNDTDDDIDEGDPECTHTMIKDTLFYPLTLIPAILIIITFSFTQRRRSLFLNVLKGAPGLIHPMDMLTKSDRISYMCALGATANLLFGCIFDNLRAIEYDGPLVMQTVVLLASVLVFGIAYFPVFGCLTTGSLLGFGTGTLYIWMLLGVELIRMVTCDTSSQIYRILLAFRGLPNILCLLYLSIRIPYKFYQDFPYREGIFSNLKDRKNQKYYTLDDLMASNIGRHIKQLLRKPDDEEVREGVRAKVVGFILDHTYRRHPSFRYSARFLSTLFLSLLLLYAISFQSYTYIYSFRKFLKDSILPMVEGDDDMEKSFKRLLKYMINTIIASVTFAAASGLYALVRMFTQYRETMFALNRGKLKHLWKDKTNDYLLLSAMKYSGYQVIYVVWGFIVQLIIFFLFCTGIAALIWAVRDGYTSWFTDSAVHYWPIPFWAIIVNVTQILMTKYTFMGHKKHLVLDNRRVLFVASYFIFFYNIFLGLFSSLLRIIKSIVIGAALLPRLDSCVLPQDFASMDPGYMTYVGFMKLENDHTHPVMLAFIRLLQIMSRDRKNKMDGDGGGGGGEGGGGGGQSRKALKWTTDKSEKARKRRAIVFKWQTLYTLINNPDLRMDRKGYMQKIKLAKELGLVIPKSDTYVSIGDDVIQEAQDLLDGKEGNVIGKIAGAAGDKLGYIKSRIQQKLKERSTESLDEEEMDLGDGGEKGGNAGSKRAKNGYGAAVGVVESDDEVDAGFRNKSGRGKDSEYRLLEANGTRGSGDISSVFAGNKRRRKKERESIENENYKPHGDDRDSSPVDLERHNYGRELPTPRRDRDDDRERELTHIDKDSRMNYGRGGGGGGGRDLPLPRGGATGRQDRNAHQPRPARSGGEGQYDSYNNGRDDDVRYEGRYTKRDDRRRSGDDPERGRSGLDGKWGSVV